MKKNNKGFFLAEAIVVIALVATVMAFVYPNISKLYENYSDKMHYYDQLEDIYRLRYVYDYINKNNYKYSSGESGDKTWLNYFVNDGCKKINEADMIRIDNTDGTLTSQGLGNLEIDFTDSNIAKVELYITGYMNSPTSSDYLFNKYLKRMRKHTYDEKSYRLIGKFTLDDGTERYASIKIQNPNLGNSCANDPDLVCTETSPCTTSYNFISTNNAVYYGTTDNNSEEYEKICTLDGIKYKGCSKWLITTKSANEFLKSMRKDGYTLNAKISDANIVLIEDVKNAGNASAYTISNNYFIGYFSLGSGGQNVIPAVINNKFINKLLGKEITGAPSALFYYNIKVATSDVIESNTLNINSYIQGNSFAKVEATRIVTGNKIITKKVGSEAVIENIPSNADYAGTCVSSISKNGILVNKSDITQTNGYDLTLGNKDNDCDYIYIESYCNTTYAGNRCSIPLQIYDYQPVPSVDDTKSLVNIIKVDFQYYYTK